MDSTRRDFLKTTGGATTLAALAGAPFVTAASAVAQTDTMGERTVHELPPLPYAYEALEPYIDAETMRIHHDKHHAGYVKGLNQAEEELAKARASGDYSLVQYWSRKAAFNGGGHALHSMFWQIMAPNGNGGGGQPDGDLADMITSDFGSFDAFKAQFSAAAKAVEGSGWGLLHYRPVDDRLIVLEGENQQKLTPWNVMPVLGVDVWEHAYYLKYQNDRGAYVDNWWNVVNWSQVAEDVRKLKQLHGM